MRAANEEPGSDGHILLDTPNDEEAVVGPAAAPGPGANREEAASGVGEEIVVPGLLASLVHTVNGGEAVVVPTAAPGAGANREEAALSPRRRLSCSASSRSSRTLRTTRRRSWSPPPCPAPAPTGRRPRPAPGRRLS